MRIYLLLEILFILFVTLKSYKLEDARHLLKNDCYDGCSESKEIESLPKFDTTNRGHGVWFLENGIWKYKRPSNEERTNKKRIRFDRRLDPDAGIDVLDTFGI